jgi:hypothetical protein
MPDPAQPIIANLRDFAQLLPDRVRKQPRRQPHLVQRDRTVQRFVLRQTNFAV